MPHRARNANQNGLTHAVGLLCDFRDMLSRIMGLEQHCSVDHRRVALCTVAIRTSLEGSKSLVVSERGCVFSAALNPHNAQSRANDVEHVGSLSPRIGSSPISRTGQIGRKVCRTSSKTKARRARPQVSRFYFPISFRFVGGVCRRSARWLPHARLTSGYASSV